MSLVAPQHSRLVSWGIEADGCVRKIEWKTWCLSAKFWGAVFSDKPRSLSHDHVSHHVFLVDTLKVRTCRWGTGDKLKMLYICFCFLTCKRSPTVSAWAHRKIGNWWWIHTHPKFSHGTWKMMWQRWFDYWMWQILGFSCIFGGEYPIVWLAWIPIPIRITKKIGKKWKKVIYQYLKMEKIEKTSIIPYPILSFCYTAMIPSHGLTTDIPRNGSWAFRLTPIRSMRTGAPFVMLHTAGIQHNTTKSACFKTTKNIEHHRTMGCGELWETMMVWDGGLTHHRTTHQVEPIDYLGRTWGIPQVELGIQTTFGEQLWERIF